MAIERQGPESVALYARWATTWNGELELSERVMAEKFVANLIADSLMSPEDICAALRGWVQAIRSRLSGMTCDYANPATPIHHGPSSAWRSGSRHCRALGS